MTEKEFTLKYIFNDVWKLENEQELESPDEEHCGAEWCINIEKRGEHLGVFIGADGNENQEITVNYAMKIVSKNKEKKCSMSTSCMIEKEFTLKYVFDDVGELRMWEEKDSPEEEHCGVDWFINIEKVKNHLSILLNANVTKDQSIFADYTMKIVSKDKSRTFLMSSSCVFEHNDEYQGCSSFIDWETLKNNYLDNGKLEVEVHVKVTEMCGFPEEFPREDLRSFGEDMKQFSDVVLKINEHKFYVSKLYLSSHSPYFSTLFVGMVQESGKSEIELKGVVPQDFQCYLEVLHLENAIDGNTVQGILSVADKFDTPKVVKKCEEFLIKESKKRLKEKLELAGRYRLEELKKLCLDEIKSKKDIRSVIPEDPMKMDRDVAVNLLQKSLDFN